MAAPATKTRRRSSRIKELQERQSESNSEPEIADTRPAADAVDSVHETVDTVVESDPSSYKEKLRNRGISSSGSPEEQDLSNLEGDVEHEYVDGDCVWAKFQDFPWWPATVEINGPRAGSRRSKRKRRRTSHVMVRWFGKFPDSPTNKCDLINVIPWDPDDNERIFPEVDDADLTMYRECMDECNTTYLQLCEERGTTPIASAVVYEESNVSKQQAAAAAAKPKTKRTSARSRRKQSAKRKPRNKMEPPPLEEIDGPKGDSVPIANANAEEDEDDDLEQNERRRSLRSAKKGKKRGREEVEVTAKVTPKRGRPRKRPRKAMDEVPAMEEKEEEKEEVAKTEHELDLESAFEMVSADHSQNDFTPLVALFHFGLMAHGGKIAEDKALAVAAKTFHIETEDVLQHLSAFKDLDLKAKRKRKTKK